MGSLLTTPQEDAPDIDDAPVGADVDGEEMEGEDGEGQLDMNAFLLGCFQALQQQLQNPAFQEGMQTIMNNLQNPEGNRQELVRKLTIPTSPYRGLFKRNQELRCMDENIEEDEEDESDEDWEEDEEQNDSNDDVEVVNKIMRNCENCSKLAIYYDDTTSNSLVFSCAGCMGNGSKGRAENCAQATIFKMVENTIRSRFEQLELAKGRRFRSLKYVPGPAHEFLGDSKSSVVLKIDPLPSRRGCVFQCMDVKGKTTKIAFDELTADGIHKFINDNHLVYVPIFGASFQNLSEPEQVKDIGIFVQREHLGFYYAVPVKEGKVTILTVVNSL